MPSSAMFARPFNLKVAFRCQTANKTKIYGLFIDVFPKEKDLFITYLTPHKCHYVDQMISNAVEGKELSTCQNIWIEIYTCCFAYFQIIALFFVKSVLCLCLFLQTANQISKFFFFLNAIRK